MACSSCGGNSDLPSEEVEAVSLAVLGLQVVDSHNLQVGLGDVFGRNLLRAGRPRRSINKHGGGERNELMPSTLSRTG
jgi:hypothetical protein